jgi:hypothetical protein
MAKKPTKAAAPSPAPEPDQPLEQVKRPIGRPTMYRPEYCELVVEWGKLGKSRAWFAAELGTSRRVMLEWASKYPDFHNALEIATEFAQKWWEDAGQQGMLAPGFNASIWSRSMAARFPADWRETKNAEITGKDGGAIQLNVQRIDVDNLPARALDALEQALEFLENPEEDEVIEGEVIDAETVEDGEE